MYRLKIFGKHNLQNIAGALHVCNLMGIKSEDFYNSLTSFNGASNRLELIHSTSDFVIYKDFAHSPSKVQATTNAVREQFNNKKLIACFELHTYSSLNPKFLKKYRNFLLTKGLLENKKLLFKSVLKFKPKIIIHLAAQAGVRTVSYTHLRAHETR